MEFYVELTDITKFWRLQNDGTFRKISMLAPLEPNDFVSHDVYEIIRLQKINDTIIIDDKEWSLNPDRSSLYAPVLHYEIFLKREIFPLTPCKEQLISVIQNGDDRIHNSLILNIHGFFELRNFSTINLMFEDPTIVLRNETFSVGNEYVGETAAADMNFIDDLYVTGLSHWLAHLKTRRLGEYTDITETANETDLINEIASFEPEFIARVRAEEPEED